MIHAESNRVWALPPSAARPGRARPHSTPVAGVGTRRWPSAFSAGGVNLMEVQRADGRRMETVFLSYSFRDQDRELVKYVEGIIESHGLKSVAGDVAGGNALDPEIAKMIKEADALVAVAT